MDCLKTPLRVVRASLALILTFTISEVAFATPASQAAYECERLFKSAATLKNEDDAFAILDQLEKVLDHADLTEGTRADLRDSLDRMTDLVVKGERLDILRELAANAYAVLESHVQPVRSPASDERLQLSTEIVANKSYVIGVGYIKAVAFSAGALKDLNKLEPDVRERMLRGLLKGIVPPMSGPGVVRMTDVHPNFVEVKAASSVERLLGCLENGVLHLKRGYFKRNGGKRGSLQPYSYLCQ